MVVFVLVGSAGVVVVSGLAGISASHLLEAVSEGIAEALGESAAVECAA